MAQIEELTDDTATLDLMRKAIKFREQFGNTRADRKAITWTNRQYIRLENVSNVPDVSAMWNGLTEPQRQLWNTAGVYTGLTGYQLFVQDTTFRILNGLSGYAIPNVSHQFLVMEIVPANVYGEWDIFQEHPTEYYVKTRVPGLKNANYWAFIEEYPTMPFVIEFDYYSQMQWAEDPEEFYAEIYVEGVTEFGDDVMTDYWDLDLKTGWQRFSETVDMAFDEIYYWEFHIRSVGAVGFMWVDNIVVQHDSQNWIIDPNCDKVTEKILDFGDGPVAPWGVNYDYPFEQFDSLYLGQ